MTASDTASLSLKALKARSDSLPTFPSDETYIRVKGRWCYRYRAIDSRGATIDFLLSALGDAAACQAANPQGFV
jgi:transposase-like protein